MGPGRVSMGGTFRDCLVRLAYSAFNFCLDYVQSRAYQHLKLYQFSRRPPVMDLS